ncbi:T9SS type A sorting domain-containing protein [Flavobacterium sp. MAH-1]|uniref:T9SS type A sorting domain-containing protein n=1 Tax=Flavobacterium agri TaxID=2743471 RepID=A0A7Y8Y4U8_9FLAO|nr:T9SS type A sorting domain-containing protein [Flavobacterium agri]NUY82462.1 T9SS type A sorting domain-containing protein [Flavobacterium agri]NYA72486.1 T9SS type A sorting domain-containing protein [Flavobacterium agri]
MNKTTFWIAILASGALSAQITYEASDFNEAGDQYTVTKASNFIGVNFGATGANHNWNYGSLTADSQTEFAWQNPNNAGYKLSWCLSHFYLFTCNSQFNNNFTHASLLSEGFELEDYGVSNIVEHARANSSGFANRMRGFTATVQGIPLPVTVDYDDPDEIYVFPMNYNDNTVNTGHMSFDLASVGMDFQYELETTRTNTVQGWGSLTTPMGTFPEVLKLKSKLEKTETMTFMGIAIPIPTTTVSYQWFAKDYGIPVLQADGFEVFNLFIPTSVSYLDEPMCLTPTAMFAYLPTADYNPETQSATVTFSNLSANCDSVLWDFGGGNTSTDLNPAFDYDCPGDYSVTLTASNSVCSPIQTATFTLPVTITDSQNALTTEVTFESNTLTAVRDLAGTTYQWVDCDNANTPVDGATSQSFTPVSDGNYACIMITNGCEGMSACTSVTLLGVNHNERSEVRLYPNPTSGKLQLSVALDIQKVTIYNTLGMAVGDKLDLSDQASGVYFVEITATEGKFIRKIVKQ